MGFHVPDRGIHAVVHALNVYTENFVEIVFRGTFQVADVGDSSIVKKDMDAPFMENFVEHSFHVVLLGYVAAIGFRIAPDSNDFLGNHLGGILVDVQHPHAGSAAGESLSDRPPNPASSSRHYCKLAIEPKSL